MPRKRKDAKLKSDKQEHHCIIHFTSVKDKKITRATATSFDKIKIVEELRKKQPLGSALKKSQICNEIPEQYEENHGYHRKCYQMFTTNLKELQNKECEITASRCKRKVGNEKDGKLFSPNCVFCGKYTEICKNQGCLGE